MRKYFGYLSIPLALALNISTSSAADLTAATMLPDTHPITKYAYNDWVKLVKERSAGGINIRVVSGSALLPPIAHLSGLRDGIADMTQHAGTYTPSDIPEDNTLAVLGFQLPDIVTTAAAMSDFYLNDPAIQNMFKKLNIVFLSGNSTPAYFLICRDEVRTIAQIKGKKFRTGTTMQAEFLTSLGGVAVNVPSSEMYSGIEKGQLDCAVQAADDLRGRSLWDVAKHVTTLDLGRYTSGWLHAANADSWAKLSVAERKAIVSTLPETIADLMISYQAIANEVLAEAPKKGVKVQEPDAELLAALKKFTEGRTKEAAIEEGTKKFKLKDVEGLVARFGDTLQKWEKLMANVDKNDRKQVAKVLNENIFSKLDVSKYGLK